MNSSVPGPDPAHGVARDVERQEQVVVDGAARPREVHLGQRRVVRAAGRDHHVVDRCRQVLEEPLQASRVRSVEGRGAPRPELVRSVLETVGIAAREDDLGPRGPRPPGSLEADAGAAADQDDGLPEQLGLALGGRHGGCSGHGSSGHGVTAPTRRRAAVICSCSALSAAT
jgi:hypothetical protein